MKGCETLIKQLDENLSNEFFIDYFLNRTSIDVFSKQIKSDKKLTNIYETFKYGFFNNTTNKAGLHYLILGAKIIHDTITIHEYEEQQYKLPEDLKDYFIIHFYCNPIHTDNLIPIVTLNPNNPEKSLSIYPYKKKPDKAKAVSITITIICIDKKKKDNIITSLLLDAFKYYMEEQYRYAIIAAHNAYELSAKDFFKRLSKDKQFISTKKSLSNIGSETISNIALKYLPLMLSLTKKPFPPTIIIDSITNLTKIRNELMHDTKISSREQAKLKDYILSALFICKYFELDIPIKDYPSKSPIEDLPETKEPTISDEKLTILANKN